MPMDGFTLSFLQPELSAALAGGRVDKVNQPERDALVLTLRSLGETHKLLLSANANQARAHLTAQTYENPSQPPMFCMLMRKHLVGCRVLDIAQISGDRVMRIRLEGMGEMGDVTEKALFLEIMGRHSNLTLVDAGGVIIDSIRHVNSEMSRVRTVLPGQKYFLPPAQDKLHPGTMTAAQIEARLAACSIPLSRALCEHVAGMASLCSKEVCAQLSLDAYTPCDQLNWQVLAPRLCDFFAGLPGRFAPVALFDDAGACADFFPFLYHTFDPNRQKPQVSLSAAMDTFYLGRDLRMRMQQRSAGLQKHIQTAISRLEKKKKILLETMEDSQNAEQNRVFGELLTAHLHLLSKAGASVKLPNYYDPGQREVDIPLDTQLTPAQNAQRYYKKYRKAKVAAEYAAQQLEKADQELALLEGALDDLDKCATAADLSEIRQSLVDSGYLRPDPAEKKRKKAQEGKPYRFLAEDGVEILVGKNSLQNDRLTLHARGEEWWLHAQGMPGSHVVVRTETPLSDEALLKAAKLAAYFSKGRNHPQLPIDYTRRKYVKKAPGSPAGFVTYTNFQTVLIGLSPGDMATIQKESASNG